MSLQTSLEALYNQAQEAKVHEEPASAPSSGLGDLTCRHCLAVLFEPTTLGNGLTVCSPCVKKVKAAGDDDGREGGLFGGAVNVVVSEIARVCAPRLHRAAEIRQAANDHFRSGATGKAIEGYTEAIGLAPGDAVLFGNRAAAYLRGQQRGHIRGHQPALALADAEHACRLLAPL